MLGRVGQGFEEGTQDALRRCTKHIPAIHDSDDLMRGQHEQELAAEAAAAPHLGTPTVIAPPLISVAR